MKRFQTTGSKAPAVATPSFKTDYFFYEKVEYYSCDTHLFDSRDRFDISTKRMRVNLIRSLGIHFIISRSICNFGQIFTARSKPVSRNWSMIGKLFDHLHLPHTVQSHIIGFISPPSPNKLSNKRHSILFFNPREKSTASLLKCKAFETRFIYFRPTARSLM